VKFAALDQERPLCSACGVKRNARGFTTTGRRRWICPRCGTEISRATQIPPRRYHYLEPKPDPEAASLPAPAAAAPVISADTLAANRLGYW
jgi:tRNA(Ile2) C34 agmatinyltransferase TiaS